MTKRRKIFMIFLVISLILLTSCNKKYENVEKSSRAPGIEAQEEDIGFESFGREKVFYDFSYDDENEEELMQ